MSRITKRWVIAVTEITFADRIDSGGDFTFWILKFKRPSMLKFTIGFELNKMLANLQDCTRYNTVQNDSF